MNIFKSLFYRNSEPVIPSIGIEDLLVDEDEKLTDVKIRQFVLADGSLNRLERAVALRLYVGQDYSFKRKCLSTLNRAINISKEYRLEKKELRPPLWQRIRFWVAHSFRFSELDRVEKKFDGLLKHCCLAEDKGGKLAFHACVRGDESLVKKLIENGADIYWHRMPDLQTLLHVAAEKGSLPVIERLTTAGMKPFMLATYRTDQFLGCVTPFMQAILSNQEPVVKYLGRNYPDLLNVFDHVSPLQQAVRQNNSEMVETLIGLIEQSPLDKNTLYQVALKDALSLPMKSSANDEVIEILLRKVKSVNPKFLYECISQIQAAVEKDKVVTVKIVIEALKETLPEEVDRVLEESFPFAESIDMARILWENITGDSIKASLRESLLLKVLKRNLNPDASLIQYYSDLSMHFFRNEGNKCPLLYLMQHGNCRTVDLFWQCLSQQLVRKQKKADLEKIKKRYTQLFDRHYPPRNILDPDRKLEFEELALY